MDVELPGVGFNGSITGVGVLAVFPWSRCETRELSESAEKNDSGR